MISSNHGHEYDGKWDNRINGFCLGLEKILGNHRTRSYTKDPDADEDSNTYRGKEVGSDDHHTVSSTGHGCVRSRLVETRIKSESQEVVLGYYPVCVLVGCPVVCSVPLFDALFPIDHAHVTVYPSSYACMILTCCSSSRVVSLTDLTRV